MHPYHSSATSRLIARSTLLAARDPVRQPLVPDGAEAPLAAILAADGGTGWFELALRHRWSRAVLGAVEHLILPGIITHYLVRKRWLERAVVSALEAGCTQVVVLGAGFDTLAWRLHRRWPRVQFFEVDHPATQAPKKRALGEAPNLAFVAVNLATHSPVAALRACPGFRADQPAVCIAEGLLTYFPEERVSALLLEFAALVRPPAEVLFSFMEETSDGSISFRGGRAAIGWWLRWQREPFQWGITRAALPRFLHRAGLHLLTAIGHNDLRTQVLIPLGLDRLPLARGECLCRCSALAP